MSTKRLTAFLCVFLSASAGWAQPYGYLARAIDSIETPEIPHESITDASALEQAMQNIAKELDAASIIPDGLQGQVQQGTLPDIFARRFQSGVVPVPNQDLRSRRQRVPGRRRIPSNAHRRSAGGKSAGANNLRTQAGASGSVGGFVASAFQFDSNGDGQLAAHEITTLFQVLTTTMNAERIGQSERSSGANGINRELIQMESVREAQSLFLQLGMSFDNDSDGQLNRAEVSNMGVCISQNNNSLIDAALQNDPSVSPVIPQPIELPSSAEQTPDADAR